MTLARAAALAAALVSATAAAQDLPVLAHRNGIVVEDGYARATGANAPTGAVYLRITNETDADDRLVAVESAAAARAELHGHAMQDGIARMRQVEGVAVPAHASVQLKSGGMHVMLMGLAAPMAPGGTVSLTLVFERAGAIPVAVPVDLERGPGTAAGHGHDASD